MEERLYQVVHELEDRHWWFRGRRAVIEALLARAGAGDVGRVLDAGCGTGRNLELYASHGLVEGVDPSEQAVRFCRGRGHLEVQVGDAQSLPFEAERFGMVAATDVLEHVRDDARALAEFRRVAAADALLLVTVPAYSWLWSAEDERLGHCRRYSLPQLRRRAEEAGWRPLLGTYFNLLLLPPIALARRLPRRQGAKPELELTPGSLNAALSLPMRAEARLIRAGVNLPAGVSIGLVCRRL